MKIKEKKEPESTRMAEGKLQRDTSHWGKHAEFKLKDDNKNSRAVR